VPRQAWVLPFVPVRDLEPRGDETSGGKQAGAFTPVSWEVPRLFELNAAGGLGENTTGDR
jgi:hypothetical protein